MNKALYHITVHTGAMLGSWNNMPSKFCQTNKIMAWHLLPILLLVIKFTALL